MEKINDFVKLANEIEKIKSYFKALRKGGKQGFNLFSAIVSGKHEREHIEMYHSNILGYLLDPIGSHDCDDFFLKMLFKTIINDKIRDDPSALRLKDNFSNFKLEREKRTDENRSIDIFLSSSNEWVIFIENKIYSGELENQFLDYCNYAKSNFNNGLGIYLTLNGDSPPSIEKNSVDTEKFITINLSYREIILWLEACCKDGMLIYTPHVISSIVQYINSLKKILHIMEDSEKEKVESYLLENTEKAIAIYENLDAVNSAIKDFVKKIRHEFLVKLATELKEKFKDLADNIGYKLIDESTKIAGSRSEFHFSIDEKRFKLIVAQKYPASEDDGAGIWYGFYDANDSALQVFNSNMSWKSFQFEHENELYSDHSKDTIKCSVLFVERRKLGWDSIIKNGSDKIIDELMSLKDIIALLITE